MNKGEKTGRLDRRITIQRATATQGAYGQPVETWADVATVWGAVEYQVARSGEEQTDAVHVVTNNVVFTIRHRSGMLETDRLYFDGNYYDIIRIAGSAGPGGTGKNQSARGAYLAITAEKRK